MEKKMPLQSPTNNSKTIRGRLKFLLLFEADEIAFKITYLVSSIHPYG